MFRRVHQVNATVHFLRERLPYYAPLVKQDAHEFRDEIVAATVGAGTAAVAGLMLACFLSVAVIVSAWESPYRITAAWCVCLLWAVVAGIGLLVARRALTARPQPFRHVGAALVRDYEHLLATVESEP